MKKKQVVKGKQVNPALQVFSQRRRESQLINAAAKANMIISLMVLHDKFGYGETRLNRFLDEYKKQLEAYESDHVEKVKDFEDVLWDECGIKVEL